MRAVLGALAALVALAVGVVSLALLPSTYDESRAMRAADVCAEAPGSPQAEPSCLAPVPARVTDRRGGRGGVRWHVEPEDPAYDGEWVRFRDDTGDDLTPALTTLLSGDAVTALYWGEDPVAFETVDGVVESTRFREDAWTALLWVGLAALALAAMWPAGRRGSERPALAVASLAVLLGCFAAVFPDRFGGQVVAAGVTAVITVVALLSLRLLGRRLAARPRR